MLNPLNLLLAVPAQPPKLSTLLAQRYDPDAPMIELIRVQYAHAREDWVGVRSWFHFRQHFFLHFQQHPQLDHAESSFNGISKRSVGRRSRLDPL